jgi:MscS family membrane protein
MGSMNLTDTFLSNSIKSYLIVLAILLVAFIIKRIISRFFAGLIYSWIVKNNHAELKKTQLHRLVVPIEQFLFF